MIKNKITKCMCKIVNMSCPYTLMYVNSQMQQRRKKRVFNSYLAFQIKILPYNIRMNPEDLINN